MGQKRQVADNQSVVGQNNSLFSDRFKRSPNGPPAEVTPGATPRGVHGSGPRDTKADLEATTARGLRRPWLRALMLQGEQGLKARCASRRSSSDQEERGCQVMPLYISGSPLARPLITGPHGRLKANKSSGLKGFQGRRPRGAREARTSSPQGKQEPVWGSNREPEVCCCRLRTAHCTST